VFVGSALLCALIPIVMSRYAAMFPDKIFSFEVDNLNLFQIFLVSYVSY
jgi:hypothetical protein